MLRFSKSHKKSKKSFQFSLIYNLFIFNSFIYYILLVKVIQNVDLSQQCEHYVLVTVHITTRHCTDNIRFTAGMSQSLNCSLESIDIEFQNFPYEEISID